MNDGPQLTLYGYWRSSAAYRVRIALNLKGLSYEQQPVHLVRNGGEQHSETFRSKNPQGLVPVLHHGAHVLTQSMAICEYLDEQFEQYPLLPADPVARAVVRSMALQIACEIHPLNNLRVREYLRGHNHAALDVDRWTRHWITAGFGAIEKQLVQRAGEDTDFFGNSPGLFECFLVPQVYNAERCGTDLTAFPQIRHITASCRQLDGFIVAAPENQPDAVIK